tara:strand:+ start:66 stop:203 length:138 start_codon:yes stop_codon:yes gene_type:complete
VKVALDMSLSSQTEARKQLTCQCGQLKYWSDCITPNCKKLKKVIE